MRSIRCIPRTRKCIGFGCFLQVVLGVEVYPVFWALITTPANEQKRLGSLHANFIEPAEGRTGHLLPTMLHFSGTSTQQPHSAFLWCICPFAQSSCVTVQAGDPGLLRFLWPPTLGKDNLSRTHPLFCSVSGSQRGCCGSHAVCVERRSRGWFAALA